MAYELNFPWEYKYTSHLSKNDDGTKDGSIIYQTRPGMAYCVAKQPKFGKDEEWEALSELWIDSIETYKKTGLKPSELFEKLQLINEKVDGVLTKLK